MSSVERAIIERASSERASGERVFPVAVFAALNRELAPLARRSDPNIALIETGEGPQNAEREARRWMQQQNARAALSIGFAGGLSPSLRIGDLVIATRVCGAFNAAASPDLISAAERLRIEGLAVRFGAVVTVDEVVGNAAGKRALQTELDRDEIGCVDMESAAIAKACAERGIPFLVARCITDTLDEDLPIDFNRCRNRKGRISSARVLRAAMLRPDSLKGLWQLWRRSQLCAERLAALVRHLIPSLLAVSERVYKQEQKEKENGSYQGPE